MQESSPWGTIDEFCVLVVPATTADAVAIEKLLRAYALSCRVLPSTAALCDALRGAAGVVVIAEEPLARGLVRHPGHRAVARGARLGGAGRNRAAAR